MACGRYHESTRDEVVGLVTIADNLRQQSAETRKEGGDIVDNILFKLQALYEFGDSKSGSSSPSRCAYEDVRRNLQSDWLRIDMLIDDLLSSASDELVRYATHAEAVIGRCEREVLHLDRRKLEDNVDL